MAWLKFSVCFTAVALLLAPLDEQRSTQPRPIKSATIHASTAQDAVIVAITNQRAIPLDAWGYVLVVSTNSQPKQRLEVEHDFYESAPFPVIPGSYNIQPLERREERLPVPGLRAVLSSELSLLVYRDGLAEGVEKLRAEVEERRKGDAIEIKHWLEAFEKARSKSTVSEIKEFLTTQVTNRERMVPPRGLSPTSAKSIRDSVLELTRQPDNQFDQAFNDMRTRLAAQYKLAITEWK